MCICYVRSGLTHVRRPVKSPTVLLVKGINIGTLCQQQIDHLISKEKGEKEIQKW